MNSTIKTSMKNLFFCIAFLSTATTIAMELIMEIAKSFPCNLVVSAKNANEKYKSYRECDYSSLISTIENGISDEAREDGNHKTFILNPLACLKFVNDFLQNTTFKKKEDVNHNWNTESIAALHAKIPQYRNLRNFFFTLCYFCENEEPEVFAYYLENSFNPTNPPFNHAAIKNMIAARYGQTFRRTSATESCGMFLDTASRGLNTDPQVREGADVTVSSNTLNTVINQFIASHRNSLPWYVQWSFTGYWYVKFITLCSDKIPCFKTRVQDEQNSESYTGGISRERQGRFARIRSFLIFYIYFPYDWTMLKISTLKNKIWRQKNDLNYDSEEEREAVRQYKTNQRK